LAGWISRNQQNVIEYLQEEIEVLKGQLGKKPRFNDDQLLFRCYRLGQAVEQAPFFAFGVHGISLLDGPQSGCVI
jgi:hypothetical protein